VRKTSRASKSFSMTEPLFFEPSVTYDPETELRILEERNVHLFAQLKKLLQLRSSL
jgi:hypothetical protein